MVSSTWRRQHERCGFRAAHTTVERDRLVRLQREHFLGSGNATSAAWKTDGFRSTQDNPER